MDIIIITTAFAAVSCLYISVIMFSNKGRLFVNSLSYLLLLFFIAKFMDLGNVIINKAQFLYYLNITYLDFQQYFISFLGLAVPVFCLKFFTDHLKRDLNLSNSIILFIVPPSLVIFISFFVEIVYFKTIYFIYYEIIGLLLMFLLIKNRKYFIANSAFDFLFVAILSYNLFTFLSFYILYINETIFTNSILLIKPIGSSDDGGVIKLLLNLILIAIPSYILFKPRLLYGEYFFHANIIREKPENIKNHWSSSKNKQILKKDLRIYKKIKFDISSIIFKLIKTENNYIKNKLIINTIENIALLIDENKSTVDFVFKYHNNLTFSKYMIKINMLKAGYLIESGYLENNSVNDLANMFGYSSRSAFYSKFKEFNDSSPSQY